MMPVSWPPPPAARPSGLIHISSRQKNASWAQVPCPRNENIIMVMRKHSCRINPVLNVAFISDMKILAGYETAGLHSWYGRVFRRPETGSLEAVKAA
jgi:hypothetical protein